MPLTIREVMLTFHLQVISLRYVEQIVPLGYLEAVLFAIFVYKCNVYPANTSASD